MTIEERAEKIAHDLAMYRHASEIAAWVGSALRLREAAHCERIPTSNVDGVRFSPCRTLRQDREPFPWCSTCRAIAAHDELFRDLEAELEKDDD